MRLTFIIVIITAVAYVSFSQIDTANMEKIQQEFGEKFNDDYTFTVDTIFQLGEYFIYSVTPFVSGYSYYFIFNRQHGVVGLSSLNKMPFTFEIFQTTNGRLFFLTYYWGNGTFSTSITVSIIELLEKDSIREYSDCCVYDKGNDEKGAGEVNSYSVAVEDTQLVLHKYPNDASTLFMLIKKLNIDTAWFDLPKHPKFKEGSMEVVRY